MRDMCVGAESSMMDPRMALYEFNWSDLPSVLVCAEHTGRALHLIKQTFGEEPLFEIDEITEIRDDNFVLLHHKGLLRRDLIQPSFRFCPHQNPRCFLVRHHDAPQQEAALILEHISALPSLVLWHFALLDEEAILDDALVLAAWEEHHHDFQLLEIDTLNEGILLVYEDLLDFLGEEDPNLPSHTERS